MEVNDSCKVNFCIPSNLSSRLLTFFQLLFIYIELFTNIQTGAERCLVRKLVKFLCTPSLNNVEVFEHCENLKVWNKSRKITNTQS